MTDAPPRGASRRSAARRIAPQRNATLRLPEVHMWIQTFGHHAVDLLRPELGDITIAEVAHSLARINRFSGHTREAYSVAQHSVLVAQHSPVELRLSALLHDAHEPFIGDIPSPVKAAVRAIDGAAHSALDELEHRLMLAVQRRWACWHTTHRLVKLADLQALVTERRDLMGPEVMPWGIKFEGTPVQPWEDVTIEPWDARKAEETFLLKFAEYGGVDKREAA